MFIQLNFKKLLMFFMIVFLFLNVCAVSAVSATENTTENIQSDDATYDLTDLQNLIDETNDTVTLKNYYVGDYNNKTVVINKNITLNGNGFSIDYKSNRPIFDIQASNVTIINLNVIRHHAISGFNTDVYTGNLPIGSICIIYNLDMPTVIAKDITKIYKNDTQYYATFVDIDNEILANTSVIFYLNGVRYNRVTDANGTAKLNINLNPGNYIITALNPVTTEPRETKIVVLPNIAENRDLVKYFRNGSQYVVKALNNDGTPAKANETVTFNINGVFYNRTTNESGYAKLNINLNPGDYVITAEYKGCKVSNNIKVKAILAAENLTKKYGTPNQFKAKLVDGKGNPLANTNVTFNINGVFYNRTTDSEGIAKLNIRLMPGEYIITSSYNECYISNKVTVTA